MSSRPTTTIGVVGIRDFKGKLYTNVTYITSILAMYMRQHNHTYQSIDIVTGGGRGVEDIIVNWCDAKEVACRKIPPNIQEFGTKRAFATRNNAIVSECDELLVFWDGRIDVPIESIATAMHLQKQATVYPLKP